MSYVIGYMKKIHMEFIRMIGFLSCLDCILIMKDDPFQDIADIGRNSISIQIQSRHRVMVEIVLNSGEMMQFSMEGEDEISIIEDSFIERGIFL